MIEPKNATGSPATAPEPAEAPTVGTNVVELTAGAPGPAAAAKKAPTKHTVWLFESMFDGPTPEGVEDDAGGRRSIARFDIHAVTLPRVIVWGRSAFMRAGTSSLYYKATVSFIEVDGGAAA